MKVPLRLMTFNLRFATPVDGSNEWEFRKDLVAEVIGKHRRICWAPRKGRCPNSITWRSIFPAICR